MQAPFKWVPHCVQRMPIDCRHPTARPGSGWIRILCGPHSASASLCRPVLACKRPLNEPHCVQKILHAFESRSIKNAGTQHFRGSIWSFGVQGLCLLPIKNGRHLLRLTCQSQHLMRSAVVCGFKIWVDSCLGNLMEAESILVLHMVDMNDGHP